MRPYPFTEEKMERWTAEGRGTGVGKHYLQWLTEGDVPATHGNLARFTSSLSGKLMVLFSDIEATACTYFETLDGVQDIRAQFPLDRSETRQIAVELGIQHPRDPKTRVDIVMTTDLVIELAGPDNTTLLLPRSVKEKLALTDFNNAEHAEIERRWWQKRGHALKLVSNSPHCMPPVLVRNLDLLSLHRFPPRTQRYEGEHEYFCSLLETSLLSSSSNITLQEFCFQQNQLYELPDGTAVSKIMHLIFTKRLKACLASAFLLDQSVLEIATASKNANGLRKGQLEQRAA